MVADKFFSISKAIRKERKKGREKKELKLQAKVSRKGIFSIRVLTQKKRLLR